MKYLAMFLEILGSALFTLIGFCIVCLVIGLVIVSILEIHKGIEYGGDYLSRLTKKTFDKYTFDPEDKRIFKDKWKDIV